LHMGNRGGMPGGTHKMWVKATTECHGVSQRLTKKRKRELRETKPRYMRTRNGPTDLFKGPGLRRFTADSRTRKKIKKNKPDASTGLKFGELYNQLEKKELSEIMKRNRKPPDNTGSHAILNAKTHETMMECGLRGDRSRAKPERSVVKRSASQKPPPGKMISNDREKQKNVHIARGLGWVIRPLDLRSERSDSMFSHRWGVGRFRSLRDPQSSRL